MSSRNRKLLLYLTLAVVVALAVFAPTLDPPAYRSPTATPQRNAPGVATSNAARSQEQTARGSELLREFPERNILGRAGSNPFDTRSWQPPPPKVMKAPEAPPPPPPPMTYRYAGRLLQDGKHLVFVSRGDTPVVAKPGDNLDGYIIESIDANTIALLHPPTGHRESIFMPPIGAAEAAPAMLGPGGIAPRTIVEPVPPPGAAPAMRGTPVQPAAPRIPAPQPSMPFPRSPAAP